MLAQKFPSELIELFKTDISHLNNGQNDFIAHCNLYCKAIQIQGGVPTKYFDVIDMRRFYIEFFDNSLSYLNYLSELIFYFDRPYNFANFVH